MNISYVVLCIQMYAHTYINTAQRYDNGVARTAHTAYTTDTDVSCSNKNCYYVPHMNAVYN